MNRYLVTHKAKKNAPAYAVFISAAGATPVRFLLTSFEETDDERIVLHSKNSEPITIYRMARCATNSHMCIFDSDDKQIYDAYIGNEVDFDPASFRIVSCKISK